MPQIIKEKKYEEFLKKKAELLKIASECAICKIKNERVETELSADIKLDPNKSKLLNSENVNWFRSRHHESTHKHYIHFPHEVSTF